MGPDDLATPAGYPAGAYPIVPPLPEHEETDTKGKTTTAGSSSESSTLSPVQTEALATGDKVTADQIAETAEVRRQKEAENAAAAVTANDAVELGKTQAIARAKAEAEAGKWVDEARARTSAAQLKLDAAPPVSYFRDGDTWGNALRGFGLALGAIGDAKVVNAAVRTGHAPPTLDTVGQIINADLERQKAAIADLKDRVVTSRTGIKDAYEARQQMLAEVDLKGQAAYAQLERVGKARLAAMGMSQPEIDQHLAILAMREKQAEHKAEYVKPLYDKITKHLDASTTAGQSTTTRTNPAANAGAVKNAWDSGPLAADFNALLTYKPGMLEAVTPRFMKDSSGQQFEDASDRLATALTAKTVSPRAAGNPEAVEAIKKRYLPLPSDTEETRVAKLQAVYRQLNAQTEGAAGQQIAAPARPAAEPAHRAEPKKGGTTRLKMPDGSIATFDASGKRL